MKIYYPPYLISVHGGGNEERVVIRAAAARAGEALGRLARWSPCECFNRFFGVTRFQASRWLVNNNAYTYPDQLIAFVPGKISEKLMVHELGHLFDMLVDYQRRPSTLLSREGVHDADSNLITGTWTGGYRRYNGKRAPENGYQSDRLADGFQMHPAYLEEWQTPTEDWADLFLNYVYRSFADNQAGWALYRWAEARMEEIWLP